VASRIARQGHGDGGPLSAKCCAGAWYYLDNNQAVPSAVIEYLSRRVRRGIRARTRLAAQRMTATQTCAAWKLQRVGQRAAGSLLSKCLRASRIMTRASWRLSPGPKLLRSSSNAHSRSIQRIISSTSRLRITGAPPNCT